METSRIINAKRNIVWSIIEKITLILFPFIIRTILIYTLGVEYVGINGLFSSILQVLSLAELGFSSAVTYSMYKPIAMGDKEGLCAILMFYRNVYRIVGGVIFTIGLVLLPTLNNLIKGSYPEDINIYLVYLIYLLNTSISYFLFAYKKSLLIAHQRKDVIDRIVILVRTISSIIQIILLLLTHSFYIYILIIPVATIINNILSAKRVSKMYPELICLGSISQKSKEEIIEKVKGLLIYKICGITRNSFDNIFISSFLGLSIVGVYSNYYYIMTAVRSFMDVITTSISASIGNSVAVDSVEKNYKDFNIFNFIYMWLCGWCTICLYCLYQPFMKLWVGESNMFSIPIVIAICIYFYVWTAGDIRSQYTDACGLWWKEKNRSIVETISNIILNYIMIKFLGVFGVIIATALSIGIIGIPWCSKILFDNYFKQKSLSKFLFKHIIYATITIIIAYITGYICSFIILDGIFELIIKLILCIIVPNLIYFIVYFNTKDFKSAMEFIRNKLL